MDAQRLQETIVCAAAAAVGLMLAAVDPKHMPEPIRSLCQRLGRYRKVVGIGVVVTGIALALSA